MKELGMNNASVIFSEIHFSLQNVSSVKTNKAPQRLHTSVIKKKIINVYSVLFFFFRIKKYRLNYFRIIFSIYIYNLKIYVFLLYSIYVSSYISGLFFYKLFDFIISFSNYM